ncbi:glycosyltransferase family 39 protein [Streptomyces mangrovisoli]|nr:glycosyltransferase family 39 protein [Streptomyces mangrovisoli]
MWRDEAASFQVARRSVPQIWRLLHGVDAVHGLYYLLMHAVLAVRPDEVGLRLPSVCAAAVAAALVAALGVRLVRPRAGLWAGLLYAVTPIAGHYAQEGRSYAMVAAGAAGATLLLLRALAGRSWWPYGAVVAGTCLLHELAVLLLAAHAVTLALTRVPGRVWRRWGCAAGAAAAVLAPLAVVSQRQSAQVSWLPVPDAHSWLRLARDFLGPTPVVFWGCVALALAGAWRSAAGRVALPLLVVPPVVLLTVSRVSPLYDERYVLYALAGAPLLVAAGADRVCSAAGRLAVRAAAVRAAAGRSSAAGRGSAAGGRWPGLRAALRSAGVALVGAAAVAAVLVHQVPLLRQDRVAAHRPDDLAAVAAVAAREMRSGDPVLYLPALVRRSALAYPGDFRHVRDLALAGPAARSGTLYGREVGAGALRRRLAGVRRLWVVADPYVLRSPRYPGDPVERLKVTAVEEDFVPWEPRREFVRGGVVLRLYVRRAGLACGGSRGRAHAVTVCGPVGAVRAVPRAPWG